MLKEIDRVFAWVTWVAAGAVVAALLFGPALIAHDSHNTPAVSSYTASTTNAKQLFVTNCGTCHTLAKAGTSGDVGPNLDQLSPTEPQVAAQVRAGGGTMPAFAGKLSSAQIDAIAAYVAAAH